ncbi:hypothetical protein [Burkholderia cepacia]|uniref:hypothetical protein n=1 Tax=Burkholderia cepacia TaxID=292 RepID=UPI0012D8F4C9|nr:hypothetical protein [Burkholderia cepacia]
MSSIMIGVRMVGVRQGYTSEGETRMNAGTAAAACLNPVPSIHPIGRESVRAVPFGACLFDNS